MATTVGDELDVVSWIYMFLVRQRHNGSGAYLEAVESVHDPS